MQFEQSPVIMGAVTIFGIASYYFTPEERWLPRKMIMQAFENSDASGTLSVGDLGYTYETSNQGN